MCVQNNNLQTIACFQTSGNAHFGEVKNKIKKKKKLK